MELSEFLIILWKEAPGDAGGYKNVSELWEQAGGLGLDGKSWWWRKICRVGVGEDFRGAGMCWEVLGIAQMVLAWDQGVTCWGRALERMYGLTALLGSLQRGNFVWCVRRVDFIWSICDWGRNGSYGLSPFHIHCLISWACPGITKALLLRDHEPYLKPNQSSCVMWEGQACCNSAAMH